MRQQSLYIWKQAPFLRLIIPFISGIVLQWYGQFTPIVSGGLILICIILIALLNRRLSFFTFRRHWLTGILLYFLLCGGAALITYYKDVSHRTNWLNRYYHDSCTVVAVLQEPLSEKTKTFKSVASVNQIIRNDTIYPVEGNIIIYFKKDSLLQKLGYGSKIAFNKTLQAIQNAGNPGSFNYQRYAAFQHQYSQVYLKKEDYILLNEKDQQLVKLLLLAIRQWVLQTITRYIPNKKEAGLAEALLIGYKDDLEKTLVQSYSNTGVVHVIAISGLHVGIIFWLLQAITRALGMAKRFRWMAVVFVITGLWLFALLAGAGPSVLRSALMFTCVAIGESLSKKTSVFNSLAISAFLLLCYNPYWLWDAGFQLSYMAVLSIVVFMKPVYNWFYISNKALDFFWKLNAVTLSAQILTLPISIYHFHQFPNYFLLTNLVAVPLSSIILIGEILLCLLSVLPPVAALLGKILQWLIACMNNFIAYMEKMPFAIWDELQVNTLQLIGLYTVITVFSYWLFKKNKNAFIIGLACLLIMLSLKTYSGIQNRQQHTIIVYHVPGHLAIDFIESNQYFFKSDSTLLQDELLQNTHLKSTRILYQVKAAPLLKTLIEDGNTCIFGNKKIIIIDTSWNFMPPAQKIKADLLIISNTSMPINQLQQTFDCPQVVIASKAPRWKVNKWRADCEKLGLACHCVVDKGAFVMNLP